MRVHHDRIGPLNAGQAFTTFFTKQEESAVGGIQVKPGAVPRRHVSNPGNRIYRAGVGGAGRSHDQPGLQALRLVFTDGPFECRNIHAEATIHRDGSFLHVFESGHVQRLANAMVCLRGEVNTGIRDRPVINAASIPGGDQRRERGQAAA